MCVTIQALKITRYASSRLHRTGPRISSDPVAGCGFCAFYFLQFAPSGGTTRSQPRIPPIAEVTMRSCASISLCRDVFGRKPTGCCKLRVSSPCAAMCGDLLCRMWLNISITDYAYRRGKRPVNSMRFAQRCFPGLTIDGASCSFYTIFPSIHRQAKAPSDDPRYGGGLRWEVSGIAEVAQEMKSCVFKIHLSA